MENLEQFIKDNRDQLDRYEVPKDSWRKIRAGLNAGKMNITLWISVAAIVTIILGTGALLYSISQKKNNVYSGRESLQSGLKETEIYYNSLVNTLYLQASPFLTGQPEIARELRIDMSQIDSICADLKKDLRDNVANQEVIEALVQNYRIKLQLLEDMLTLLKQNNNDIRKNKSHEL